MNMQKFFRIWIRSLKINIHSPLPGISVVCVYHHCGFS